MSTRHGRGQSGLTLLETLLAVMLSSLMILPVYGWAAFAMKEQRQVVQRNLNASSLGLLRAYFTRDAANADWAATSGDELGECGAKDSTPLVIFAEGERRIAYALVAGEDGENLVRRECATPGGAASAGTVLLEDVAGGTRATCVTTAGIDSDARILEKTLIENGHKQRERFRNGGMSGVGTSVDTAEECRRVTLHLNIWQTVGGQSTGAFRSTSLTASLRTGARSAVPLQAPIVVLTAEPKIGLSPLKVRFDASASSDPEGGKLTFAWDFGDGATGTDPTLTHEYRTAGTYVAKVTVTSDSGTSATGLVEIRVLDNAPVAVIAAPANNTSVATGVAVSFSSEGSGDPVDAPYGGKIVGYAWDFGDGTTSTEQHPKKTYTAASPTTGYTVKLTVTDNSGRTGSASITLKVTAGQGTLRPPYPFRLQKVEDLRDRYRIEFDWDTVPDAQQYQVRLWCDTCGVDSSISTRSTTAIFENIARKKNTYKATVRSMDKAGLWGPWSPILTVEAKDPK